uniref:Copalyl diphosphate synthase 3 n=1 Tax=Andrographis paniculata TaxID=175694 RepID=A0A2R4LWA4_ANDPA|nr:copalyl diphosphate synthase 3 [Andrographis paniculata]
MGFGATLKLNSKYISPPYLLPNSTSLRRSPSFYSTSFDVSDELIYSSEALQLKIDVGIKDGVENIRTLLRTMDDGRISVSPYDTAWVALIKDAEGRAQFPSALDWIAQNQLPDGSWGDKQYCVSDRLVNTLACVVALRSWNIHSIKSQQGISYIKENVYKLENADAEHMMCGFEIVFPAILQRARELGIEGLPYDAPVIAKIHNARTRKMERIPKALMHEIRTSLLYSLEGLDDLDWKKLLKLQSGNGSFLTSPSSTAFAFMETGDENCLRFISNTVQKFNGGGVPTSYPVDIYARLWAVDRLQRLGVSHHFEPEIKDMLSYVSRFWSNKGVFSCRDLEFCDIDDTSMGFRLLRMHGYDVDPKVFDNFRSGNKFSCIGGEVNESSSAMYNLYRASQLQFLGENILEAARSFAYNFLQEKLEKNQILDKWIISKHLPDEIRAGLEMPWYGTMPRVETRYYLQHYAGGDEVWLAKTLYRMEEISNDAYLELARLDFKRCQEQHQIEWSSMKKWYENSNVDEFGITRKDLLVAYFLAAASIFEPERLKERVAWAKSRILTQMVSSLSGKEIASLEQKNSFINEFENSNGRQKFESQEGRGHVLLATLHQFLDEFNGCSHKNLKNYWGEWLMKLQRGEVDFCDASLLATTLNICASRIGFKEDILSHSDYTSLANLTNKICRELSRIQSMKASDIEAWRMTKCSMKSMEIEQDMQALVKLVLEESGIDRNVKQAFLSVAKTYYYGAYTAAETTDSHIFKVLFEPIV